MTEKQLQDAVLELAGLLGYLTYHTFDSRKSQPGFPDLVLVRVPRLVFAELKDDKGTETIEQIMWLDELGKIDAQIEAIWKTADAESALGMREPRPGVEVHVWRPAEWTSGEIERVLR